MKSLLAWVFTASLPWLAGCGGPASGEVFRAEAFQGRVDTSLPQELQAKQETLRRLLNGLQEGIGEVAALRIFLPGVEFRESFDRFFEGQKRLVRWEFQGRPHGNEVPVVLYFDDRDSGPVHAGAERRAERVYLVSGYGPRYTVSRR